MAKCPADTPSLDRDDFALFSIPVWIFLLAIAGFVPGYADDMVWATATAVVCFILGMVLGVGFHLGQRRRRGDASPVYSLVGAAIAGAGLGLFSWLVSLIIWLILQIALGGRVGPSVLAIIGAVTGAAIGWVTTRITRYWMNRQMGRWLLRGVLLLVLAGTVLFLVRTGPRDLSLYPNPASSPYRLPWSAGITRLCIQGNRAVVSHREDGEFAYDFAMPVGSDVCAARAGVVIEVEMSNDGNGFHARNNYIVLAHGDGTFGCYHHLKQNGSYVQPGQHVRSGESIAASGNVGTSMLPHLHFHVSDADYNMLPVTFADVQSDAGIPRMFHRYISGNSLVLDSSLPFTHPGRRPS
jgi:hypothetical protein